MSLQSQFKGDVPVGVLVGTKNCPYVHRVIMVALYHGINLEIKYLEDHADIVLKDVSPTKKVPILRVNQTTIFESNIIMEYLNDLGFKPLLPQDTAERAEVRSWISYSNDLLFAQSSLFDATCAEWPKAINNYHQKMDVLEKQLEKGGVLSLHETSLVDIAYAPLFLRLNIIEELLKTNLIQDFPKIRAWGDSLLELELNRAAVVPEFSAIYKNSILKWPCHIANVVMQNANLAGKPASKVP